MFLKLVKPGMRYETVHDTCVILRTKDPLPVGTFSSVLYRGFSDADVADH